MRELTLQELELIAGGTSTVDTAATSGTTGPDVVVTADPGDDDGGYFPPTLDDFGGGDWGYGDNVNDGGGDYGGGGGDGTATEYAQLQFWGGVALDFIVNYLAGKAITASERETKMADQFDPNQVVANMQGMDANGNIDHGWRMQDGSAFFDTNNNGKPDMHMWTDAGGNVWADEGSGRTLIRGTG